MYNERALACTTWLNIPNMPHYMCHRRNGSLFQIGTWTTEIGIYFDAHLMKTDILVFDHIWKKCKGFLEKSWMKA